MLLRDLVASPADGRVAIDVRRPRTVIDQAPATTSLGRLDQGFDRLVIESGSGISPVTAVLLVVLSGLLTAGLTMLASDGPLPVMGAAALVMCVTVVWFQIRRVRRM